MPEGLTIRGLEEAQRNLANFPRLLVAGCFAKALSRAAAVFEEAVAVRTPESDRDDELGHLLEALMSEVTIDAGGRGGRAQVGFGKLGFRALWVEYGHRMVGHKPGKRQVGTVQPRPFMRPAFEAAADAAIEAFADEVRAFMSQGSANAA